MHYNAGWVAEVRSGSKTVKILPRILFEGWSVNDYMSLFASERMMQEVAEFITQFVDVSDCIYATYMCRHTTNTLYAIVHVPALAYPMITHTPLVSR